MLGGKRKDTQKVGPQRIQISKIDSGRVLRSDKHIWNIIFIFVGKSYTQNVSLFVTTRSFITHLQIAQIVKRLSIILWEGSWRMALEIYFGGISKVLPKESNGTVNTTYEKWIGEFFWPFGLGNLGKNWVCDQIWSSPVLNRLVSQTVLVAEDPIYEDLTDEQI